MVDTATSISTSVGATNTANTSTATAETASQSPSALHSPLQHQSKSFPPRLQRTPSISSQSSLDSTPTRQSVSIIFLVLLIFNILFDFAVFDEIKII